VDGLQKEKMEVTRRLEEERKSVKEMVHISFLMA
jgi:hypothetical protein